MKSSILNNLRSNLTREVPFFCKRRLGEVLSIAGTELALSECTSRLKYFFKQNTSSNPHPQLQLKLYFPPILSILKSKLPYDKSSQAAIPESQITSICKLTVMQMKQIGQCIRISIAINKIIVVCSLVLAQFMVCHYQIAAQIRIAKTNLSP